MISVHHLSEYPDNFFPPEMAFRNDPYNMNNNPPYATDSMIWDNVPPVSGGSSLLNSRTNSGSTDNGPFSSLRKPVPSGFSTSGMGSNSDFAPDGSYSSFGTSAYGSSVFSARNDRENFSRSGESPNTGLPSLSGAPASRPVTVNGNFSRSVSTGQGSPSATPGFGSSAYTANSFAPSQYSGQSQPLNLNSFSVNNMKSGGYDDTLPRSSILKRQQMQQEAAKQRSSNMGMSPYGSSSFMRGNMFNTSNGTDSAVFDMSEFPSLSTRNRMDNSLSFANILSSHPKSGYGMLKEGGREKDPEFQMHHEDFPALPGAEGGASLPAFEKEKNRGLAGESSGDRATPNSTSSMTSSLGQQLGYGQSSNASLNTYFQPGPGIMHGMPPYRRIMTEPSDRPIAPAPAPQIRRPEESAGFLPAPGTPRVTYVPQSIVQDHFGLFGFLQYMKCLPANSSLPLTSVGCDLHALGLVFNPLDATPKRFKGYPFLHSYISDACTAHICHLDVDVPAEYLVSITMPKDKVAPPRISRFSEDLLFYLFYGFPGDIMQFAAAMELYARDWRFHKEEKVWITRIPNQPPTEKTTLYERGQYQIFDSLGWRKTTKEMHVEYAKLDERATFPSSAVQLMPNFLQSLFN